MKNSLLLFISLWATTVFAQNPIYLDANGVTIKAHEWAKVGDKGFVKGVRYTVVDEDLLRKTVKRGWKLKKVCTSKVTDMSNLFNGNKAFKGDISRWDVSKVTDMSGMFAYSRFNGDISNWDVSNVTMMWGMFRKSPFNGDISKWDVSNVTIMWEMFAGSTFKGDISNWNVSNVVLCYIFNEGATYDFPKPNFTNCDCGCN